MTRESLLLVPTTLETEFNDPRENLRRVEAAVSGRLARNPGRDPESFLFIFPELTLTGFVTDKPVLSKISPPSELVQKLMGMAKYHRVGLVAGFPEAPARKGGKPRNCLVLIGPDGKMRAAYRKMHLFTVGDNPESAHYERGASGIACEYRGWKIGFSICFDARFPALYHEYAKAGADLVIVSACWIGGPHKSEQFRTLCSSHAIAMQAYVAAVNQSGRDPFFEYDGARYVFSPFGDDIFRDEPCALDYSSIEACRKMRVRSADRTSYKIFSARGPRSA